MTISLKTFSFIKTMRLRSRRERFFVVSAMVTVFAFLLFKFAIDPFLTSQEVVREEIPVKMKQLEKYRQYAAGKALAEKNLQQVRAIANQSSAMMLAGKTSALAAADLQDILKSLAAKNLISIKSENVLDTKSLDSFEQIPVQIEFITTITNLTNFLYNIEIYNKILTISDLNIRVTSTRNPRDVRVTIIIAGFMKGDTKTNTNPLS